MPGFINGNDSIQAYLNMVNNSLLAQKSASSKKPEIDTPNDTTNKASSIQHLRNQLGLFNDPLINGLNLYNSKGVVPIMNTHKADEEIEPKNATTNNINVNNKFLNANSADLEAQYNQHVLAFDQLQKKALLNSFKADVSTPVQQRAAERQKERLENLKLDYFKDTFNNLATNNDRPTNFNNNLNENNNQLTSLAINKKNQFDQYISKKIQSDYFLENNLENKNRLIDNNLYSTQSNQNNQDYKFSFDLSDFLETAKVNNPVSDINNAVFPPALVNNPIQTESLTENPYFSSWTTVDVRLLSAIYLHH